jgi:hypothetical protein
VWSAGGEAASGWSFAAAAAGLEDPDPQSVMMRQLRVADRIAFKVWRLSRALQLGAAGVAAFALVPMGLNRAAWSGIALWSEWTLTLGQVALALAALVVTTPAGLPVLRRLDIRKRLQQVAIGFGMATVGFVAARLHLHAFDRLFLRQGRLPRPGGAGAAATPPPPGSRHRVTEAGVDHDLEERQAVSSASGLFTGQPAERGPAPG